MRYSAAPGDGEAATEWTSRSGRTGRASVLGASAALSAVAMLILVAVKGSPWSPLRLGQRHDLLGEGELRSGHAASGAPRGKKPPAKAKRAAEAVRNATSCSWDGKGCQKTKCCKRADSRCFVKNDFWASCLTECPRGDKPGDSEEWRGWACNELGGFPGSPALAPAAPGQATAGTSLFCFTVVTRGRKFAVEDFETKLLAYQEQNSHGIFACEDSAVHYGELVPEGDWNSVANTKPFVQIWKKVLKDGGYARQDWTVKVDVDAVFLPARLRVHIGILKVPQGATVYLRNIDYKFDFMGALEVLSKAAVEAYLAALHECTENIGTEAGEDLFTKTCLEASGVGHMTDFTLLDDKYASGKGEKAFDITPCAGVAVAFHHYKDPLAWKACMEVAEGRKLLENFIGCGETRRPRDVCSQASSLKYEAAFKRANVARYYNY